MALFKETFSNVVKTPLEAIGKAVGATAGIVEEAATQTKEATPGAFRRLKRIGTNIGVSAEKTTAGLMFMSASFELGQMNEYKKAREEASLTKEEILELRKEVLDLN